MIVQKTGHALGFHRVLDDPIVLPQNAQKLDATPEILSNEILIDVDYLQIDSASFHQLQQAYPLEDEFKNAVADIIKTRGKMQNPVTGSGGMLLGRVAAIGPDHPDQKLKVGDRLATLISLTATPLALDAIKSVDFKRERVGVSAKAMLFEKAIYAVIPDWLSEGAAVAAFDICGAPLLSHRLIKENDTVLLLGLGKAGRSVLSGLLMEHGSNIKIIAADASESAVQALQVEYKANQNVSFYQVNATDPIGVATWIDELTDGTLCDVTINLVNVGNTEMPSILATKDGGACLFFSMATDFQKATLGCESVAKDVRLLMGTGYVDGHADYLLRVIAHDERLKNYFEQNFGGA